jgi:hypothetical protein
MSWAVSSAKALLSLSALCLQTTAAAPRESQNLRATALIGAPIQDESGELEAVIRDIVLDAALGSVRLVVVELSEPTRRTVAVPWSYLVIRGDGEISWRATEEQILTAPSVRDGESAIPEAPPPTASDEPRLTFTPTEEIVERFDPARVETYRGFVAGTITAPFQEGAEDVVAIIELPDGRTIHARLGPELYLTQIGLSIVPGQAVLLEGFALDVGDRPIVVVSASTVLDKRYVLRNLDGTPLWRRRS